MYSTGDGWVPIDVSEFILKLRCLWEVVFLKAFFLNTSWFVFKTVKSNDSGIQQSSDDGRESLPSTVSANSLYEPGEFWWNSVLIGIICWKICMLNA